MSLLSDLINLNLSESTEKIIAEYIWIGGSGLDLRSKAKTLPRPVADPAKLPKWNYDGSRSDQAPGDNSEVTLKPQAIFKDPFRRGNNILVICDAYTPAGEPHPTNKRVSAVKIFSHPDVVDEEPWYGINQEYTLLPIDAIWALGGFPGLQVPHYTGRDIAEAHYKACLYAGINVSGINGEVVPGQWEFKPSVGIAAGDQVWAARYILKRITEKAGLVVSFDPEPPLGDLIGARARTSYSTKSMRAEGSYEATKKVIEKLRLRHKEHIEAYGTADNTTSSWGLANCGSFIEDRRPAADMDPYVITSMIAETAIIWKPSLLEKMKSVAKKCICNH